MRKRKEKEDLGALGLIAKMIQRTGLWCGWAPFQDSSNLAERTGRVGPLFSSVT